MYILSEAVTIRRRWQQIINVIMNTRRTDAITNAPTHLIRASLQTLVRLYDELMLRAHPEPKRLGTFLSSQPRRL